MIRPGQSIRQTQSLQQRLSPQQIQYIKLLQLPTLMLEQRVKQEIETNPVLELDDDIDTSGELSEPGEISNTDETADTGEISDAANISELSGSTNEPGEKPDQQGEESPDRFDEQSGEDSADEPSAVDKNEEIDWESFFHDDEGEYVPSFSKEQEDWRDLPKPYRSSFTEQLERQVELLDLDERQQKIADQIIGSIDSDGYLRRDLDAIIDTVAFNDGVMVTNEEAEKVLHRIQRLDPPGIAARNLRECLMVQLEMLDTGHGGRKPAMDILKKAWPEFEKKHYEKIQRKLNLTEAQLRDAHQIILLLDPKPGESDEYLNPEHFIIPDFEVWYEEAAEGSDAETGDFVIKLNKRNMPNIRISRHYRKLWDSLSGKSNKKHSGNRKEDGPGVRKTSGAEDHRNAQINSDAEKSSGFGETTDAGETRNTSKNRGAGGGAPDDRESREVRQFIREKMESARWFIESIQQRQNTLMAVMRTIVALQEEFFKTGKGIRPMILKDIAERIQMDISTVSRVVNGKYVQTHFGVYELKYFFTEGMETDTGESVSNREIKNILLELVNNEDKSNPLSDQALADALVKKGYPLARRTISKYRQQLNIPVARMRKDIV